MKHTKKLLSIFLALTMMLSLLPTMALATDTTANVATRAELEAALADSSITEINITADIDMGGTAWTGVVIASGRTLTINGNDKTISNMTVNRGALLPSGSGVAGDGGSCDYYCGWIANNNGDLIINDLNFSAASVDIDPLTVNERSTGSSILAVVVANNNGTLVYNDVDVSNSTVKGYTKVGILHGFSQGSGTFVANHCSISGCSVVLEADGTDSEAAFSGVIIGYDGNNKAKTNGIKLSNNTISIDGSVDWGDTDIIYNFATGVKSASGYGLTCETYTHGRAGTAAVIFAAEVDGYAYETLADAIAAAENGQTVTLLKDIDLGGEALSINKAITLDGDGHSITSTNINTIRVCDGGASIAGAVALKNLTIGGVRAVGMLVNSPSNSSISAMACAIIGRKPLLFIPFIFILSTGLFGHFPVYQVTKGASNGFFIARILAF